MVNVSGNQDIHYIMINVRIRIGYIIEKKYNIQLYWSNIYDGYKYYYTSIVFEIIRF